MGPSSTPSVLPGPVYDAVVTLQRSSDKILAGVCGGLAEEWDMDPTLVRVLYAVLTFFSAGLGIVLYIVLYLLMEDPEPPTT